MPNTLKLFAALALLVTASTGSTQAQRAGISVESLQVFDEPAMPATDFRVLRTTYAPGGQNPRHQHNSHVVFYVLHGAGIWHEDGRDPVTLKPGESLHVRPGVIHSHRNASSVEKLVFLEFVVVTKGKRSTVPMQ